MYCVTMRYYVLLVLRVTLCFSPIQEPGWKNRDKP